MRIGMSEKQPLSSAANLLRVRYSAAYPTGAERGLRRGNYCVTLAVSEGSDPFELYCVTLTVSEGSDPLEMEEG